MRSKKSQYQKRPAVDTPEHNLHAVLMAQALDAYAAWLDSLVDLDRDQTQLGSRLVATIAEIGRGHVAKVSTRINEMLVVHTKLSTLWLERQHETADSARSPPRGRPADYDRLVKRQNETIAELRRTLGLPPQTSAAKSK